MEKQLVDKEYAERQLVVVAPDDAAQATREAEERATVEKKGMNWARIGELALIKGIGLPGQVIIELAREAIKAWSRARDNGVNVHLIGRSEARALTFPPGHPRDGVLYVGHPTKPAVYYTMADFHRLTFEHKFSEVVELLMALGATEIAVQHVSGWSKEFSGKMNVPLSSSGLDAGAKAGASHENASDLLLKAALAGTEHPRIPDNLVWLPHEPTWQTIAKGRTEYGLQDFSLSVRYEDDFGVNAGLKVMASKVGFDLGGKFEDHQSTVWSIAGKFKPVR